MQTAEQKLVEACKIIGITRVAIKPAAKQVSDRLAAAISHDQEFWFGPTGQPIGIYTPDKGIAALKRCLSTISG